ncbi:SDR family oxidoreductase [Novosphingobium sp. KCTC 2891]|uniref:SDR family NAD(P)-dependent oxidoreductase n=1 Tax=Novosphingobium sp. KCTC 2891 TaxID=2989730 RepID=UPI0022223A69|nr:SDR family oxidoreductase [Novosphingobium sp. KCTC 2891]MCW1384875.1 SDR family oxidoreductase [Novosphingobium sp. KCTC 2891]
MTARPLEGRVVAILGASQRGGAGWNVAKVLAAAGADVHVAARRLEKVEELAEEIGGTAHRCDATDEAEVAAFVEAAAARTGQIDIAVAAVGLGSFGTIDDTSMAKLNEAMQVNFFGPFQFARFCARHMNSGASIVLFSSIVSTDVLQGSIAYAAAKGALNTFTRYAAFEYAPRGIRVNAIKAGMLEGPQARRWRQAGMFDRFLKEIPLTRAVETEELARMIIWLANDAPSITGEIIHVDGGAHLRRPLTPDEMAGDGLASMGKRRIPEN